MVDEVAVETARHPGHPYKSPNNTVGQNSKMSVFQNEKALRPDREAAPINRSQEIQRIKDILNPIRDGRQADDIIIHGPSGVGKTTCVKHAVSEFDQNGINTVYVNCWNHQTRTSILIQIIKNFNAFALREGHPADKYRDMLKQRIEDTGSTIIVLDEFDRASDRDEIVYDLKQTGADAGVPVSLILVSDDGAVDLDPRAASRLSLNELSFCPYDEETLLRVLRGRAKEAFREGVIDDEALELIASTVTENGANCRNALQLLRRAGQQAEWVEAGTVSEVHVERAMEMSAVY